MSCALNEPRVSRDAPGRLCPFPLHPSEIPGHPSSWRGGQSSALGVVSLSSSSRCSSFVPNLLRQEDPLGMLSFHQSSLCSVGLPQCCTVENFPVPRLNPSLFHFRIKQALSWPQLLLLDQQMWLSTSWKSLPEPSDTLQAPKELFRHPSANLLPL